ITAIVTDDDDDDVSIRWKNDSDLGIIFRSENTDREITWQAPITIRDTTNIIAIADDGKEDGISRDTLTLIVSNNKIIINNLTTSKNNVLLGNKVSLTCLASDPENGPIKYTWSETNDLNYMGSEHNYGKGVFLDTSSTQNTAEWKAPLDKEGTWTITVTVTDNFGEINSKSIDLNVYSNYGVVWVADAGVKKVKKFSSKGAHLLDVDINFNDPRSLATNAEESFGCYAGDYEAGMVYKIDENGNMLKSWETFNKPIDLDIYKARRHLWVLDAGDGSLTRINCYTETIETRFTGFYKPNSMKVNQKNGDVWICDTGNNRIVRITMADSSGSVDSLQSSIFSGQVSEAHNGYSEPNFLTFIDGKENIIYISDKGDNQIEIIKNDGTTPENTYVEVESQNSIFTNPGAITVFANNISLTQNDLWLINNNRISFYTHDVTSSEIRPLIIQLWSDISDYQYNPYRLYNDNINNKIWVVDNGFHNIFSFYMNSDDNYTDENEFTPPIMITELDRIEDIAINQ
ncbi:hypothetical protein KAJ27_06090, partial [bacterium]|nr:hypothetical protein [bacterium]